MIEHGTPAFLRTNLALFSAGLATFALLYCTQPLLPVFAGAFQVSAAGASLALSLTTGVLAVALPAASAVSEVRGRKPVMVVSVLSSAVLLLACAAAPGWPALLALRALMGLSLAGLPAVAMAYVGEEMHPRSVGYAMGLYVGGSGLGGLAGRLITGVVTDAAGWRAALLVIGLIALACGALLWRSLPPSRHFTPRDPRLRSLLRGFAEHGRDPVMLLLFFEGFSLMGGFVTIYNYVTFRLLAPPFSLSQTVVGFIFAVYLLGVAASAVAGRLIARVGRWRLLPASLAVMLLGTALTRSGSLGVIVAGVALLTVGFFAGHSVASTSVGLRAQQARAQASSLYLFAYYAGSSVVGSLGGFAWARGGWDGVTGMTGALLLAALAAAGLLGRLAR